MPNYNTQLQSNNIDLQAILNAINELPEAGSGGEQATPVISVNSTNGLITATAGTKSSTYQMAFQPAKTITPSATSQIAVSSGYYTGGNITVAGDSNLVAGNIKRGVSIFGVSGTLEEGSGGSGELVDYSENEDAMVTGTLSSYFNDRVATIGQYAFYSCPNLSTINFPAAITINQNAFYGCSKLSTANFPAVITIGQYAFYNCLNLSTINFPSAITIGHGAFHSCPVLTTINFPAVTDINSYAFEYCGLATVSFPAAITINQNAFYACSRLSTANFPAVTNINGYVFRDCFHLKSLYLMGSTLCTLSNSNAFTSTPIGGYSTSAKTYGSIYVPASLLTQYQTATNWVYFSSRFVGI